MLFQAVVNYVHESGGRRERTFLQLGTMMGRSYFAVLVKRPLCLCSCLCWVRQKVLLSEFAELAGKTRTQGAISSVAVLGTESSSGPC